MRGVRQRRTNGVPLLVLFAAAPAETQKFVASTSSASSWSSRSGYLPSDSTGCKKRAASPHLLALLGSQADHGRNFPRVGGMSLRPVRRSLLLGPATALLHIVLTQQEQKGRPVHPGPFCLTHSQIGIDKIRYPFGDLCHCHLLTLADPNCWWQLCCYHMKYN